MNKETDIIRLTEERDMLEMQRESDSEKMKDLEEDSEEWNYLWDEINAADNEIADLDRYIIELEELDD